MKAAASADESNALDAVAESECAVQGAGEQDLLEGREVDDPGSGEQHSLLTEVEGLRLFLSARNKSGYKGVVEHYDQMSKRHDGSYEMKAGKGGRVLGRYNDAVSAAVAYAKHMQQLGVTVDDTEAAETSGEKWAVGERLYACDKDGAWASANVIGIRGGEVKVHFHGWHARYDEWIPISARRLSSTLPPALASPVSEPEEQVKPVEQEAVELGGSVRCTWACEFFLSATYNMHMHLRRRSTSNSVHRCQKSRRATR
jgi:hypothetical protein